jgi:dTDP-4-dehydrorhamnose reductase
MQGERVLVTGGAGFIGSNLAEVLEEGSDVVIFDDDMSTGKLDIDANLLPIKTSASGSKAKRPMFLTLVSVRIEEYGLGMPGWEEGSRGFLDERGYFRMQRKRRDNN